MPDERLPDINWIEPPKIMDLSIRRIRITGISALQQQEIGTDRNCPENRS
jgi:hypothetical protein